MKKPQLGYYGQDITLNESKEFDGFYDVYRFKHNMIFSQQKPIPKNLVRI